MKKTVLGLLAVAALMVSACNTTETHDRSVDKPAGSTQGPESGQDARQDIGEDTDDAGRRAADEHGTAR